jgi:hypothetical protein
MTIAIIVMAAMLGIVFISRVDGFLVELGWFKPELPPDSDDVGKPVPKQCVNLPRDTDYGRRD